MGEDERTKKGAAVREREDGRGGERQGPEGELDDKSRPTTPEEATPEAEAAAGVSGAGAVGRRRPSLGSAAPARRLVNRALVDGRPL